MEKEFVLYELSVKLKELGFDEPCLYYFNKQEDNLLWQDLDSGYYRNSIVSRGNLLWGDTYDNGNVSAPLWQQAWEWFREKHELPSWVYESVGRWFFKIVKGDFWIEHREIGHFKTYEEARQACLEKLIEIVEDETI